MMAEQGTDLVGAGTRRLSPGLRGSRSLLTGVSLSFLLGVRRARGGRSLAKPSPRSAAILRPPSGAVTTRQAASSCRAKLRGAARERQHPARALGKSAAP